jgi:hypothetical protein
MDIGCAGLFASRLAPTGICERHRTTVGAGLLAKRVCQVNQYPLTHRIREQARSHMDPEVITLRGTS